jgi:hypothetical protein
MYRGDTLQFAARLVRDPTGILSLADLVCQLPPGTVVVDITGHTIMVTVKHYIPDPDAAAVWTLDNATAGGVTLVDPTKGKFTVLGSATPTLQYPDGDTRLPYDVQDVDASGVVSTVEIGEITIMADVTRRLV